MKAMIFAAGLGKRLGKITENIPKALVEINGKTALHLAVEKCSEHGFGDIIINVHHFADMVEDEANRLIKMGFRIMVSDERDGLLETGGGFLEVLYRYHLEKQGLVTLAVRKRPGKRFYLVDESGLIRGWRNNETGEQILTSTSSEGLTELAFSSMHIVQPEIFNYMNEGIYTMTNLYLRLAKEHNIFTLRCDEGYWVDIGHVPCSMFHVPCSMFHVPCSMFR